jgi:hypothetical protein
MYVCIRMYMYVCMCIYIHTYIHTYYILDYSVYLVYSLAAEALNAIFDAYAEDELNEAGVC